MHISIAFCLVCFLDADFATKLLLLLLCSLTQQTRCKDSKPCHVPECHGQP